MYTGLEKGIKLIGDVNMYLFIFVWLFVFVLGPTLFLVNLTTSSMGQYFFHFLPLSLYTAPGVEGDWLGSWTVFYWAWWMSWAPFVAVFIARNLPLTWVMVPVIIVLIATFFWTSANSASVALAMFVSGKESPGRNLCTFWGIALGGVAAVLAGFGSLKAIQTVSIATAFPLMFLLLLVVYGTFRGLNRFLKEQEST